MINIIYLNTKSRLGMTLARRYPSRPSRVERNRNERPVTEPLLFEKTLKYKKTEIKTNDNFSDIPFTTV